MVRRSFVMLAALIALALASLISTAPAQAAGNAKVYVVHGIPGRDLGLQPSLPVDVSVNGACALTRFKYTDTVGPIELPAGSYDIKIHLSASLSTPPCSGPVAVAATVPFASGENATIVAHLTDSGAPTASKFMNDVTPASAGNGRIMARHTAPLPPVDLIVKTFSSPATLAVIPNLANGQQVSAELPVNTRFRVQFALVGTTDPVRVGSVKARPGETVIYHAVGSVRKNTFTLIELRVQQ
ncbi:DUF4397 domain-containing protein [Roseiflexus castenholzii]|uniref:DUF4397 domain-containing protein n=1 Tax=Roseiflexus castenholzii (strain DSM 13941 / HLO8) TaxID=383372 RepID=A7NMF2_ROSCS|nr:DUF4397 domain-containing protein [Roseiflexus castenholzii]ABU58714.1 conserved hypothetical protein [Roseiflexus castenholzii DSM 13941]